MSEEEIKIFIDEYYKLKNIQNSIKEIDKDFFFDLVDKLLDLYNKEKIKSENHKIAFEKQTENLHQIEEELNIYKIYTRQDDVKSLDLFINEKYISKDKIKEKIDKLENLFHFYAGRDPYEWDDSEFDGDVCDDIALQIRVLKELLEEAE